MLAAGAKTRPEMPAAPAPKTRPEMQAASAPKPPPRVLGARPDAIPSDFPVALGALDLEEVDLPAVSPEPPASKPRAFGVPPVPAVPRELVQGDLEGPDHSIDLPDVLQSGSRDGDEEPSGAPDESGFGVVDLDLPTPAAHLPMAARPQAPRKPLSDPFEVGLPTPVGDLPVAAAGLPVVAGDLPAPAAALPAAPAALPIVAAPSLGRGAALPVRAERGFGEIDLPMVTDALPAVTPPDAHLPQPAGLADFESRGFGEIDLPREVGAPSRPPSFAPPVAHPSGEASFGDLQLGESPKSPRSGMSHSRAERADGGVTRVDSGRAEGGMSFGEVDLAAGGRSAETQSPVGVEAIAVGGDENSLQAQAARIGPVPMRRARSQVVAEVPRGNRGLVAMVIGFAVVLGGAALQLTPYGAFGYLAASDVIHAGAYEQTTSETVRRTQAALAPDTYDAAKAALEAAYAAHASSPRARVLTAYSALLDFGTVARFGPDAARASRAKPLLSELPPDKPTKYLDAAFAAQLAEAGDIEKARSALKDAADRAAGDPAEVELVLLRGETELAAHDAVAAKASFTRALQLSGGARAHFGLARAYELVNDISNANKELDLTLAASPQHPGALTLRARLASGSSEARRAAADLAAVLDGPARAKASPFEIAKAYAARGWFEMRRSAVSAAREAFAQAMKLNPSEIEALNGEGKLLMADGRSAEALARFDTALRSDPNSPSTIANDAEAKIALERLADAKQQLLAARERFPKSIDILLLLARAEQRLSNEKAAEENLKAALAVAVADPNQPDAVRPYAALSKLLASRGHVSDARAALDDAGRKLPPSAELDRAFGEVSELEGNYEDAIARYRSAVAKDGNDLTAHFQLASTLRRVRRFDAASAELDRVAALDGDYPGLALERGLLFEQSGDVERALEQFRSALARAPEDPDLQLRVGSAYVAIGRPEEALPMLRKVLEKRPTSAEAHHYIGRALMLQGASTEADALHYLQRAVELDPTRAEFHVWLAWAANDATPARLELARDEVDRALALDALNADAYWQRGAVERKEAAIEDAIKDEKRALELRPSRYEAHATLAECYEDKNQYDLAMAEWARALAGDAPLEHDGSTVPHPYWHYRYGKLLMDRHGRAGALPHLLAAAIAGEKLSIRPGWLAPLEFLAAEALRGAGRRQEAAEHYKRFLEIAPVNSPDRADAQAAVAQLTGSR
jgi:tetratricopeptide (TPR) repeat protein